MRTIQTLQQAGPDKCLHLTIPVDEANRNYQVVVVVEPTASPGSGPKAEAPGWPSGFFDQVAGAWLGDFVEEPEGEPEKREEL